MKYEVKYAKTCSGHEWLLRWMVGRAQTRDTQTQKAQFAACNLPERKHPILFQLITKKKKMFASLMCYLSPVSVSNLSFCLRWPHCMLHPQQADTKKVQGAQNAKVISWKIDLLYKKKLSIPASLFYKTGYDLEECIERWHSVSPICTEMMVLFVFFSDIKPVASVEINSTINVPGRFL